MPPVPTGIPFPRLMLTITLSVKANLSSETHSRYYPESDKGKESMPDADNPAANTAPYCSIVFTIDDKVEF